MTGGGAGTHAYTLDNLYRLTSVTYPGAVTDTYTYDQLGNRLTKNATSYTYDDADEMTAAGGTSYTYDLNGNQLTRGADTFTWDHENRLTQSVVGGVTSSSVYYGNGVRRSHTVNGVTTTYTYDVASSLPVVVQDGTNSLVYGLDLISTTDGTGNRRYFSYDGLGSTSDLSDAAGNVTDTYSYDVFGAVRARTGTNASPWKFTGEQEDGAAGDSGYYFLRARYYDANLGRFASRDPLEFDQRYAYASGNPVRYADPTGLESDDGGSAERSAAFGKRRLTWRAVSKMLRGQKVTDVDLRPRSATAGAASPTTREAPPDFSSPEALEAHWQDHRSGFSEPFGYHSSEDYLAGARRLVSSGDVYTHFRSRDAATLYYRPQTNEFAILSKDNVLTTYYRPRTGYDYWLSQLGPGPTR